MSCAPMTGLSRMFALLGLVSLAACGGGSAVGVSGTSGTVGAQAAGALALSAADATVPQSTATVSLRVNRVSGSSGAVTASYATSNGTASAGTDYTSTSGTLSWADGDATAKTLSVPIVSAAPFTGAKTFSIALTNTTGGATLGTPGAAMVTITGAGASGNAGTLSIGMQGNHFVDAGGNVVQVRGVNVSGLESGVIFTGGTNFWQSSSFSGRPDFTKIAAWRANAVRLPLNEASWLGLTVVGIPGNGIALDGAAYQAEVKATVAAANAAGLYVILDLHWTAPGFFAPNTQNPFLNADNSVNFWSSIANAFAGNQAVMFELFNEPFVCPASNGGVCSAPEGVNVNLTLSQGGTENYYIGLSTGTFGGSVTRVPYTYNTVSYQTVINAIRATGAANVIICGGNNYDDDLTWWTQYPPTDPLSKLAAAVHQYPGFYPNNAVTGAAGMNAMMDPIAANHPVIVTELGDEVGSNPAPFAAPLLAWADAHGYSVMAWAWNPWGGTNTLIQDATTYTPTPGLGQTYHDWTFNHQ